MKRLLELFSGTGSWNKYCASRDPSIEVVSVDIEDKFHTPTHLVNILDWDYTIYPPDYFDIISSSPPCRYFSVLQQCGKYKKSKEKILENIEKYALPLLYKTLEIIKYFTSIRDKVVYYFIENPLTGMMRNYIPHEWGRFIKVDYCRFGYDYKKPTIIFTNKNSLKDCRCIHGKAKHKMCIGTPTDKTTLEQRYSIPQGLIHYLLS